MPRQPWKIHGGGGTLTLFLLPQTNKPSEFPSHRVGISSNMTKLSVNQARRKKKEPKGGVWTPNTPPPHVCTWLWTQICTKQCFHILIICISLFSHYCVPFRILSVVCQFVHLFLKHFIFCSLHFNSFVSKFTNLHCSKKSSLRFSRDYLLYPSRGIHGFILKALFNDAFTFKNLSCMSLHIMCL